MRGFEHNQKIISRFRAVGSTSKHEGHLGGLLKNRAVLGIVWLVFDVKGTSAHEAGEL